MSAPHIGSSSLRLCAKNFHSWWKFDEVLTKIILRSFFRHCVCCVCYSRLGGFRLCSYCV